MLGTGRCRVGKYRVRVLVRVRVNRCPCLGRVLQRAVHLIAQVRRQRGPNATALESRLEAAIPQRRQRLVCAADQQPTQEHLGQ